MKKWQQNISHFKTHLKIRFTCQKPTEMQFKYCSNIAARVHNISIEGECLTAYIPCTNALRQVTPVNYRILSDLIHA